MILRCLQVVTVVYLRPGWAGRLPTRLYRHVESPELSVRFFSFQGLFFDKCFWGWRERPVLSTTSGRPWYPPQCPHNCQKIRTWRFVEKTFRGKKSISWKTKCLSCPSHSRPFVLSLFSVLRVKNWNWNWNNQKKKSPSLYLSKNLENTYRKKLINMWT